MYKRFPFPFFFFNDTATTEIYTLSLHDALPIYKRYSGDNRLIGPKSPHRRPGLAPRCRLVASWGWSRSPGLGCSPIKSGRELGSERRETVRSLSATGAGRLAGPFPSTRGPGRT